jgi:CTP synthase
MKYVFITGGVVSSLGKGIAAASIGLLLKQRGLRVVIQKFDPYLNVDPGTMSPYQHGEVYVTDDGGETDLDLGHYERFLDQSLTRENSVTAGKVYQAVIERERSGGYLGKTVQVVPHITDEIKARIRAAGESDGADVIITEIGGTTGDIESLPFLEACRQMRHEEGADNCLFIHLTLVPYIKAAKEIKTKPTQHSVKGLLEIGIQPDVLLCRTEVPLGKDIRSKIALFCNVRERAVIEARDVPSIYHVPLHLHREGLDDIVLKLLHLEAPEPDLEAWERMIQRMTAIEDEVRIAVVGKYVQIQDAYKSIIESFTHAGVQNDVQVTVQWVDAEDVEKLGAEEMLRGVGGILVPGGFGERGISGKVDAVRYARENDIPFLGICLGLQCAVIEFARHVCGIQDALSSEFSPNCPNPVIDLMEGQTHSGKKGGTMRLGAYPCKLRQGTLAAELYGTAEISERHRHRWEVNNGYRDVLERNGLVFSGTSPDGSLVEIIELSEHPYFIASQFHPELKSRPNRPHPMFFGLVRAAKAQKNSHASARQMSA